MDSGVVFSYAYNVICLVGWVLIFRWWVVVGCLVGLLVCEFCGLVSGFCFVVLLGLVWVWFMLRLFSWWFVWFALLLGRATFWLGKRSVMLFGCCKL